ncbi:MAG: hypothetical protein ACUZ8E_04940 [Candidatus Anammoxibacter sp.]
MKLTKNDIKNLKDIDVVEVTHNAREETSQLLNDQGFTVLSIAVSNFIVDIANHPENIVKEFAH